MGPSNFFTFFFSQLTPRIPSLLVYLVGLIVTVVLWRRAPKAAMFALNGLLIMLVSSLSSAGYFSYVYSQGSPAPRSSLMVINLAFSVLSAAGASLLLAAVFVGRPRPTEVGFAVLPPRHSGPPDLPRQP